MVENAVNQQEKKRKAGTVLFADKMPSKNDDDDSDDDNELNQFESLSINEADNNEETGRETSTKECNSLDQTIDVNLSIRGTLVGPTSNPLKRIKRKHEHPIAFGVLRTSKGKKRGMCEYYSTPAQQAVL